MILDLLIVGDHSNDTKNYLEALPKIIDNYNNTYHKSIKELPYNVYVKDKTPRHKVYMEEEEPKFQIGDYVRKTVVKKLFEKGFTAKWSEDVYIINKIDDRVYPIMYKLKDLKGHDVEGKFYKNQLLKSDFKNKIENNNVKNLIKEGKAQKRINREGLGDVILDRPQRERRPNPRYL